VHDPSARPRRHPDALPPVDAPLVPGGGPAALPWFDRRATVWLWCALGAASRCAPWRRGGGTTDGASASAARPSRRLGGFA
jgi:hypothetical protein